MSPSKPVIFLHIPKTAGTSLIELVSRNFAAHEICRIVNVHRPVAEIASDIEVAVAEGARFVCGHFPYAAISHLRDEVQVFTILRDPVDRIVSLYRFWRGQDPNAGSEASQLACRLAQTLDFEAFLRCEHPVVVSATRDEMCKSLASHVSQRQAEAEPAELFQSARGSLSGMLFGLVDDLDRTLRRLSRELGMNLLDDVHLNRSSHLPTPELTAIGRELILGGNMADSMLYRAASRQFARDMTAFEVETLHQQIGERALTAMLPDDRGAFHWDASMPVAGAYWNDRECMPDGTCWRFTSTPETLVYLPNRFPGRSFSITVEALFFNRQGFCGKEGRLTNGQCFTFELDGVPVDFHSAPLGETGESFYINVTQSKSRRPFITLALQSAYGLSPSVFGSPDSRVVTAAISSIRLAP